MQQPNQWDVLGSASLAEESVWTEHATGFVNSFVQKDRRERWLYLLLNRPKQIYSNSHKLHSHLNWSICSRLDDESQSQVSRKSKGVYYNFTADPVVLTLDDAFIVGMRTDGIFSIVPGKLAIYFFHEDEIVLCKL